MAQHPLHAFLGTRSRRSFAALVRETRRPVLNAAYRVLGDAHLAEDVAQEVYMKILEGKQCPESIHSPLGWLLTTTLLTARARLRGEVRRNQREERRGTQKGPDPVARELVVQVRDAVLELPGELRETVELRYFAGLGSQEIAGQLGVTPRAINKRLARARAFLETRLSGAGLALMVPILEGAGAPPGHPDPAAAERTLETVLGEGSRRGLFAAGFLSMKTVLLNLVAGVLIAIGGIALWSGLGDGGEPRSTAPRALIAGHVSAAATTGDSHAAAALPGAGDTIETAVAAGAEPATAPAEGDDAREDSSAAGNGPVTLVDADDIRIHVEVVDEHGARVPDAVLHFGSHGLEAMGQLMELQKTAPALLAGLEWLLDPVALREEGNPLSLTDFPQEITGIAFECRVEVPHKAPGATLSFQLQPGKETRLRFQVSEPRSLVVQVVDEQSGQPVESAQVVSLTELRNRDFVVNKTLGTVGPGSAVSDSQGRAVLTELSAGDHDLELHAEGYRALRTSVAADRTQVTLELEPILDGGRIVVWLVGPGGEPVAGIPVQLGVGRIRGDRQQTTDTAGRVVFASVPAEERAHLVLDIVSWALLLRNNGWNDLDGVHQKIIETLVLARGEQREVTLGFLRGTARVLAQVVDPDGRPVEDLQVTISGPVQLSQPTRVGGRVSFTHLPAGTYSVSLRGEHSWGSVESLEVGDGGTVQRCWIHGGCTLRGRIVRAADGTPIAGATLALLGERTLFTSVGDDGTFVLTDVTPGRYVVIGAERGLAQAELDVELEAGADEAVVVALSVGGHVRVELGRQDAEARDDIQLAVASEADPDDRQRLTRDSERRSRWSSDRLSPGHYRLHFTVPGEPPRTLRVEVVNGEDTRVRI